MTNEDEQILKDLLPQLRSAVTWSNSNIANKQEMALKRYKREELPGDDKIKGKSKWVSPKVMQHVDWLTGQLLRIFETPETVVEFCPVGAEDEAIAKQQTDVVNFILKSKNSHETYLTQWLQNGALTGLGVVTVEFEVYEEESLPRLLKGVPDTMLPELSAQEDAGQIVIEEVGKPQKQITEVGIIETRDIKIRTVKRVPCLSVLSVKPEDFVISKDAVFDTRTGGISAKIQGHRKIVTKSDLLEMGYDRDKVEALPNANDKLDGIALVRSRDTDSEQGIGPDDIEIYQVYTKLKIGRDKKHRHYRLTLGGSLENNPVLLDYIEVSKFYPYAAFVPFPLPDYLFGLGVADRVEDDHTLITKMYRAVIDDLHMHVNPIKVVNPDVTNIEDLLNPHAGAIVRSQDPAGGISFQTPPFAGADALPVIEQLAQSLEYTTGVGPTMSGINAEDFQRTSATAANLRSNASQLLIEVVARWFAGTGYKYLVKIVVDLLVSHPEEAQELVAKLKNGEVVPLDMFDPDFDVKASDSFGGMSRDQSTANLSNMLNYQLQVMGNPALAGAGIVNPQNVYSTLAKLAETSGYKNTARFFTDPATLPPAPPSPPHVDPNAGLIEMEKVKAQLRAESEAAKRAFEMEKFIADLDRKRDEMTQKFELKLAELEARYGAHVNAQEVHAQQAMPRDSMGNFQ
ncbi:portal protein [Sinorhizobium medicae]|uniref:portal protein n=1 Tax=Sinorhizobium medicae TaxID=110321 RepID=UPI000FD76EF4|nr:portal protein [Sinorhizobium medicae]RVK19428.1 portal protein [Sinorhizobium medicae]